MNGKMLHVLLAIVTLLAAVSGVSGQSAGAYPGPIVGLWVTRFDYRTEDDVRTAISRAADLGVTDVFWQVRGQGDAFYRSELEPWGEELLKGLPPGKAPSFDPLALAVAEAHKRGLRLHAWVNIMPLWKGKTPPRDKRHPFHMHPEWRLRDAAGNTQALNDHYVIVNPLLGTVQNHIVAVCRDIVTRYPVDGLHMDYVRFVSDTMKDPAAFPGDPQSISIFEEQTGNRWTGSDANKAAFREYKRQKITDLVRRIKIEAVLARPGVALSAAVWRRPELAREQYLQDAAAWLRVGTLDRAMPMIYTDKDAQFEDDLNAWLKETRGGAVTPGLGIYLHGASASGKQLDIAALRGASGYALFAYASMFESPDPNQDKSAAKTTERAERLRNISQDIRTRRGLKAPSSTP